MDIEFNLTPCKLENIGPSSWAKVFECSSPVDSACSPVDSACRWRSFGRKNDASLHWIARVAFSFQ
jgi:hypothetical protein